MNAQKITCFGGIALALASVAVLLVRRRSEPRCGRCEGRKFYVRKEEVLSGRLSVKCQSCGSEDIIKATF